MDVPLGKAPAVVARWQRPVPTAAATNLPARPNSRGEGAVRVSIIIPVLNEATGISAFLQALAAVRATSGEVIVVDGGSTDQTAALATPHIDRVVHAAKGRAAQMNAGATVACGSVLLFLHADTQLPPSALVALNQVIAQGAIWGHFDVTIEGQSHWLKLVAAMMNWRSRLTGIATGDQAIFVTRAAFKAVGGFPQIALMEDIALSKLLKKLAHPACLSQRVVTSGRRWERHGVLRTMVLMWRLRLAYFFGADPNQLARRYAHVPHAKS
jgi:rSAM/selenodomain-associated transferase 2